MNTSKTKGEPSENTFRKTNKRKSNNRKKPYSKGSRETTRNAGPEKRPEWLRGAEKVQVSDYTNDIEFYNANPLMLNAVANLPAAPGQGYHISTASYGAYGAATNPVTPGFINYLFVSGPGYCDPASSEITPIENVATNLFTKLRMNKNGTAPYTKADLIMYIQFMDELYTRYYELRRAVGCYNIPHPINNYVPDDFIHALGIPGSISAANIASVVARLNYLSTMINQWPIPTAFKTVQRHADMVSAIYVDHEDARAQYFAFSTKGYRNWVDTAETGTVLAFTAWGASDPLMSRLNYLEQAFNTFSNSESAALIRADILTAYAGKGSYQTAPIDTNYVTPIRYDSVINMQIQNATILSSAINFNISENLTNNTVTYKPVIAGTTGYAGTDNLYFTADIATPEMVAEATRFKFMYKSGFASPLGAEILVDAELYVRASNGMIKLGNPRSVMTVGYTNANAMSPLDSATVDGSLQYLLPALYSFGVKPVTNMLVDEGTGETHLYKCVGVVDDVNLIVPITYDQLRTINLVCLNSMYGLLDTFEGRTGTTG